MIPSPDHKYNPPVRSSSSHDRTRRQRFQRAGTASISSPDHNAATLAGYFSGPSFASLYPTKLKIAHSPVYVRRTRGGRHPRYLVSQPRYPQPSRYWARYALSPDSREHGINAPYYAQSVISQGVKAAAMPPAHTRRRR